jgi:hypothetical protein
MHEEAAREYLHSFLQDGEHGVRQAEEDLRRDGVEPDFSLASVVPVFEWLARRVRVGEVEPSANVPADIVEAAALVASIWSCSTRSPTRLRESAPTTSDSRS